ncbi:MAG: S8 family serine peptidase, partial [Oscillospiraceae bacterium]|nr:S8 family serine peptidase [Oscillospiraceae bacterium]
MKKRILAFLLAVCLLTSLFVPAASAVAPGEDVHVAAPSEDSADTSGWVGAEGHTRKDGSYQAAQEDPAAQSGFWTATISETDATVDMMDAALPAFLEQMRSAEFVYEADELVSAFVVLEEQPLAETYSSILAVPAAATAQLESRQEALVATIETEVLGGSELEVQTQFTYLTNSVVISTAYGNLDEIAALPGVKDVFLTPVYEACTTTEETVVSPLTVSSGVMSGVEDVWEKYTGKGMTVAVIDTGIDMDHPSFKADPALGATSWNAATIEDKLSKLNALEINPSLTAKALYYSAKLPYTFNYVTGTTDVNHSPYVGDHGSHVAGIVAANKLEGSNVVGMAPDAQLVVMQVFDPANGGAALVDILNALEDAMTLECDVANLSLGSPAGFSSTDVDEVNAIYQRITQTDIIVDIAAGNEGTSSYGNRWGTNQNPTEHIDNATISSPSTYANAMAVASVDNAYSLSSYFTLGEEIIAYNDGHGLYVEFSSLTGTPVEYVMVPGLGEEYQYEDIDVTGKVAVVQRGEITFAKKLAYAEAAGAIGVIIVNNEPGSITSFGMSFLDSDDQLPQDISGNVPAVLVTQSSGEKLAAAATKIIEVAPAADLIVDEYGGQPSSFSSWGVSPDLRLVPDIAGVGGNVYSCFDDGTYGFMSGTSMASPQVAGVTALVLQYLRATFPEATAAETRVLVDSLLMSTAKPVMDKLSGVEASPRHQGAGLVNALDAVSAEAYLTVENSARPKAELGDSTEGTYTFKFTVHNFGTTEKTYSLSASLLTEDYTEVNGKDFMAERDRALDKSAVSFSANTVTVAAGSTADVTVTITLTDADKTWLNEHFANGNYVEGYIYLSNAAEDGVDLNLPFLGFYGAWDQAPLFDTGYWYNNSFWSGDGAATEVEASEYFHVIWTDLAGTSWVLGFNPYTGALRDENGDLIYDPANNIISNNGDGLLDGIEEIYLSLMRNARTLTFTYTDEAGNVVDETTLDYVTKTMYRTSYGQIIPSIYSWYDAEMFDFTDAEGEPLPSGTKLTLKISGTLDYEGSRTHYLKEIPITLDTEVPTIVGSPVQSTVEGRNYLTITVSESALAYAQLMNPAGTQVYGQYSEFTRNEDGTYTVVLDVTDRGNDLMVALCDYGANEVFYALHYEGENLPELDASGLYAYRVYDAQIYDDSLYGWVSVDKTSGAVTRLTNDMYEYYAINAAEYAGGYVFAVDAGYNFLVMDPGLWNRKTICNLGINVVDMAFDETTGTMYLSGKTKIENGLYYCGLYTVDLTTGELTELTKYSNQYAIPWAMTFVDGELYAIKYYNAGLFKVNMETWALEAVKDANGTAVKFKDSLGRNVAAMYAQSMTYSKADGKIYWPYFKSGSKSITDLFAIDPETFEYTITSFPVAAELVGALNVEDDGYKLPVSEEVSRIILSSEAVGLREGDQTTLSYNILPWNLETEPVVTWSSADESIATVENGVITGVKEGTTTVTASCGGVTAECIVNVTHVEGTLYFYDYYDHNGSYEEWMSTDLATMESQILWPSDIDFISGDYTGHEGNFYGYTEDGAFYRVNMTTGEYTQLEGSGMPWDMAYDYSTGLMYKLMYGYYSTSIRSVNMTTGVDEAVGGIEGAYIITLACSTDGILYGVSDENWLCRLDKVTTEDGEVYFNAVPLLQVGSGYLQLIQSMCYDHNSGKLIWAAADHSIVYWIDIDDPEHPFMIPLGDPTDSGAFQIVGLHVIPEEVPELPYVAVQSLTAESMYMQIGKSKAPVAHVYPFNATNKNVTWSIEDTSIATIDENGMVKGLKEGETTLTATLVDGENTLTATASVTVMEYVGTIHGFVLNDLASGTGNKWAEIEDTDPSSPTYPAFTADTIYAAEYMGGKVYAYVQTSGGWQFQTIDPETYEVEAYIELGEDLPEVCDMTYDYVRGTMYALAGNKNHTDLYIVDMDSGALMPYMSLDVALLSLAASPRGVLYGMDGASNTTLYTIDVDKRTCTEAFTTGVMSNTIASMAFDFDTGYLCWAAMYEGYDESGETYVDSRLVLIDVYGQKVYDMGNIGSAGTQLSGMFIIADSYPEKMDELYGVALSSNYEELLPGATVQLYGVTQPSFLDSDVSWSSADPSVATVDENGLVTAVQPGATTIMVSAEYKGKTCTACCAIVVLDIENRFLSYNVSKHGWTGINRLDPKDDQVIVVEDDTAEDYTAVQSAALVGDVIYGYDTDNRFFKITDRETFTREYLGECDVPFPEEQLRETDTGLFEIRDLAYDPVNERLLAIGTCSAITPAGDSIELRTYSKIYAVDMSNGHMTELTRVYNDSGDATNIYAFTITDDGQAFVYETYMHYLCALDLETGKISPVGNTYSFSAYGGSDCEDMALEYDPVTHSLYLLMYNQNTGYKYHQMFRFNLQSYTMSNLGRVGARVYNKNTWRYEVDTFATLMIDAEHSHAWGDWIVTVQPDCTNEGVETRTCLLCGQTESRAVPALGHDYTETRVVKPACDQDGYTEHVCGRCGHSYRDNYVEGPGHAYETVVTEATCTEVGYTTYTCATCGYSYVGDIVEAKGHDYTSVVTEATCTEAGYTTHTCATCGHSYVDSVVQPKGHAYTAAVTEPTHEKMGYTTYTCAICGHSYVTDYVEALGHTYTQTVTKEPSCTEEGVMTFTCDCGASYTQAIPMTEHNYTAEVTEPTCTAMGYTTYTCDCGHSYVADFVE